MFTPRNQTRNRMKWNTPKCIWYSYCHCVFIVGGKVLYRKTAFVYFLFTNFQWLDVLLISRVCGYSYRWWNLDWGTACGRRAGGRGGPFLCEMPIPSGSTGIGRFPQPELGATWSLCQTASVAMLVCVYTGIPVLTLLFIIWLNCYNYYSFLGQ